MKLISLLLILSLGIFSPSVFARKPAVEPVIGISIDQYKEVSPEKAKGFSFTENPIKVKRLPSATDKTSTGKPKEVGIDSINGGKGDSAWNIIPLIVLLPLAVWFALSYGLRRNRYANRIDNTTSINDFKKEKEFKSEDDSWPKAS